MVTCAVHGNTIYNSEIVRKTHYKSYAVSYIYNGYFVDTFNPTAGLEHELPSI